MWIQRYFEVLEWREQLAKVPDEHRAQAEEYLRSMADRMRVIRALKAQERL